MTRTSLLSLLLLSFLAVPATAQAEDGTRWRMSVTPGKLKPITIADKGRRGAVKVYWYVVLEVKNATGKDRHLSLAARGLTPKLKQSPVTVPGFYPSVTKAIAQRERDSKIVNLFEANGTIKDGQTKKVLLIFANLSKLANQVDLRVKGLANTLYKEGNKVFSEDTELSVRFHRIGDEFQVTRQKVETKGSRWVEIKRSKVR